MADHGILVDQFTAVTGCPSHVAEHILEAHDWNVDVAINFYLECGGIGHGGESAKEFVEEALAVPPDPLTSGRDAPRSSPIDVFDEDEEGDIGVLASNLAVARRNSVEILDDDDDWIDAAEDVDMSDPERNERRVRRNRPSGASIIDSDLRALGHRMRSSRTQPIAADVLPHVNNPEEDMQLPDDVDVEEQRMLMAALTGDAYEGRIPDFNSDPRYRSRDLSPGALSREQLRREQDFAYEQSLVADKMKAEAEERQKAEAEAVLAKAAAEEERCKREIESASAALKRTLTQKEASLPREPALNAEDAVVLVVRLPTGIRLSRRFRQSDQLSAVFDFVDVCQRDSDISPGSYKLVSQFPWRVFEEPTTMTLADASLIHKQEALFIEMK